METNKITVHTPSKDQTFEVGGTHRDYRKKSGLARILGIRYEIQGGGVIITVAFEEIGKATFVGMPATIAP